MISCFLGAQNDYEAKLPRGLSELNLILIRNRL